MLFTPHIEEATVAQSEVLCLRNAKTGGSPVNPFGGAFKLSVVADRRFVDHAVTFTVRPLSAPFLIEEGRDEAERDKELGQRVAAGKRSLNLNAVFMPIFAGNCRWQPLVRERPATCIAAYTENFSTRTQSAIGRVVENIAFKAAWSLETKTGCLEAASEKWRVRHSEFDLGFDGHRLKRV